MNVPHNLVKIDINEIKPSLVEYIQNEADNGVRVLDVMFLAQGRVIALGNGYTATATVSVNDVLITDNLSCTVNSANNLVSAEIDCKRLQLTGSGVMKVQITVSDGTNILISPQPVLIRLTSDLSQTAQILPDPHSSYAEIVAEIVAARGDFDNLAQALSHLMGFLTSATVNNATDIGKIYYTTTDKALIIPVSAEFSQTQFRLARDGKIYARRRSRSSTSVDFPPWGSFADISAGVDSDTIRQIVEDYVEGYIEEHGIDLTGVERTENRVNAINSGSTDTQYPSAKAVYTELSGKANKSETYTKTQVDTALSGKANTSDIPDISGKANKATTLAGYGITDAYKKIDINQMFNQVDADLQGKADAIDTYTKTQTDNLLNAKESTANKVTAVNSSASDTQYPSAKAVYNAIQAAIGTIETQLSQV